MDKQSQGIELMEEMTICKACSLALMEDIKNGKLPLEEAEYRGRKVKLNKPMRGDVKKLFLLDQFLFLINMFHLNIHRAID